jgi:RsmE family RNA methyltransferase
MNLILLTPEEAAANELHGTYARAEHIRTVLRATTGDTVFVGAVGGKRGRATLGEVSAQKITWTVAWEATPPEALPLHLLVGLARPQTVRKILQEGASLGFASIHFFRTEKGDPAYAQSSLWRDGEAEALLRKGTAQAFTTRVPELAVHESLDAALHSATAPTTPTGNLARVFLDIYEAPVPLVEAVRGAAAAVLAIGPERGWSARERDVLRAAGFVGAHMGEHVLRVETACIAAGAVALASLGVWRSFSETV